MDWKAAAPQSPADRPQPSKLFVEITSRCNLNCAMCLKQSAAGGDGDLSPATFAALEPVLPELEALVLNGIGEPLLHPRLEQYIRRARELMPAQAWIGFQTNGQLLTEARARSLVAAGLDRLCLSLDGAAVDTFRFLRSGGELAHLDRAFAALAGAEGGARLQLGVEFVVMRHNLRELPAALHWAASRGARFALVSHVLPYAEVHLDARAYDLCTDEALRLFQHWQGRAARAGIELQRYFEVLWKYARTPQEQQIVVFAEALKQEARTSGIHLDLKQLLGLDQARRAEVEEIFAEARAVAQMTGLDLRLPATAPRQQRRCSFVEEGGAFVAWDGRVHPCYYLWHACQGYANNWRHPVRPQVFGHLAEAGLREIWQSPDFRAYRQSVLRHDYPYCPGCNFAPCDYVQAEPFEQDCYLNAEPCGSCLWSTGLFQCLA